MGVVAEDDISIIRECTVIIAVGQTVAAYDKTSYVRGAVDLHTEGVVHRHHAVEVNFRGADSDRLGALVDRRNDPVLFNTHGYLGGVHVDARLCRVDTSGKGVHGRFGGVYLTGIGCRHKPARIGKPAGRVKASHHRADLVLVLQYVACGVLLVGYVLPLVTVVISDITVGMAIGGVVPCGTHILMLLTGWPRIPRIIRLIVHLGVTRTVGYGGNRLYPRFGGVEVALHSGDYRTDGVRLDAQCRYGTLIGTYPGGVVGDAALGGIKPYAEVGDRAVELVVFVGIYPYLLLGCVKVNTELRHCAL